MHRGLLHFVRGRRLTGNRITTMKTSSPGLLAAVALIAAGLGYWWGRPNVTDESGNPSSPAAREGRSIKFYQSPMHPWIVSDEPGRCTICGMAMVPVYEGEAGFSGTGAEVVQLGSASAAVIGVATSVAHESTLYRTLRVNGTFEMNHTRHRVLSARVSGRIETLHINHVGMRVETGDPLVSLYSPEMLTAQRIYVERRVAGPGAFAASQVAEARERLLDLGITPEDLSRLEETHEPVASVTLLAPFDGIVVRRGDRAYTGAYVQEADMLFEIGDMSSLWFVFDVYETDLGEVRPGLPVTITPASPAQSSVVAPVSFIDPNIDPITRTAPARVVVPNRDGRWHHRQTATAELTLSLGEHLSVPRSAVLFTRQEPVVFVAVADQTYQPTTVTLGPRGDDAYAITSGLKAGDRVVSQAALILEGQAQLTAPPSPSAPNQATMMAMQDADIDTLRPFVLAVADAAETLSADSLASYVEALPQVHEQWSNYVAQTPDARDGPLDQMVNALNDGPTLTDARESFEPFSTAVADLATQAGLHHSGEVSVFQCPMSPVLGTGRWVQRGTELRNPFFGADMLTCGSPVD